MDVLGPGPDLLVGEAVERLAHQLEVGVEVPIALHLGQAGQEGRIAVGGHELLGGRHPVAVHAPLPGAADGATGQIGHRVGGEGAGDASLGLPECPIGQDGLGGPHGGGGVGDVVGQHLGPVRSAPGGQGHDAGVDDRLGQGQRASGSQQVGGGTVEVGEVGTHPSRLPGGVVVVPTPASGHPSAIRRRVRTRGPGPPR